MGSDQAKLDKAKEAQKFQSTLPVWGATLIGRYQKDWRKEFQSTLPVWGATRFTGLGIRLESISIHAPRVGSDSLASAAKAADQNFNPRSPCGERHNWMKSGRVKYLFQSTLPVWGATPGGRKIYTGSSISIHAPRVGSDADYIAQAIIESVFQSTLPVWGATAMLSVVQRAATLFQSTLPVWGATQSLVPDSISHVYFNPRSPCGERHKCTYLFL